jgi:hypothetical protein
MEELNNQPFYQSKRTSSEHNGNFDFDNIPVYSAGGNFSYSAGGTQSNKYNRQPRMMHHFDDLLYQQDLNNSNFLPKLQKYTTNC